MAGWGAIAWPRAAWGARQGAMGGIPDGDVSARRSRPWGAGRPMESKDNMDTQILGIHHVTAIAGDPQRNLDFYTGLLGLRLVKLTVNYDDPGTYHLYYGDATGRPGTILTFFTWPDAPRGRLGTGQTAATALAIPRASLGYWVERLVQHGVAHEGPTVRFGTLDEETISFRDPDGLALELVAAPRAEERPGWEGGSVPAEHAIRGVHGVTLWEERPERTAALLTETLGFRRVAEEGGLVRYAAGAGGPGTFVDVRDAGNPRRGSVAVGTVHHVAYRTPTDEGQRAWLADLAGHGAHVSPIMDRQYFHSIYFREPGGVLFEIATDLPGFATDEPTERLGTGLRLPAWLESHRAELEAALPPARLPGGERVGAGGVAAGAAEDAASEARN